MSKQLYAYKLIEELEEYAQPVRVPSNTMSMPFSTDLLDEIREMTEKVSRNSIHSLENCNIRRVGYVSRQAILALQCSGVGFFETRNEMSEIFATDGAGKIDPDDRERLKIELAYHWTLRDSQFNHLDYEYDVDDNIMFARGTYNGRPAVISSNLHDNRLIRYYTVIDYNVEADADNHFEDLKRKYL